jgi:hypothetical protein
MLMGRMLNGTTYYVKSQYAEALLFTQGAISFSIASQKTSSAMDNSSTEPIGIFFCLLYILCNSFTPQAMAGTDLLAVRQDKCGYLPNDVGCQHIGYCNDNSWIFSQW